MKKNTDTPSTARIDILGRSDDGSVDIEIEDPVSGVTMFRARLTAKQFMTRLSGRVSSEEITCTWGPVERLGWLRCTVRLAVATKPRMAKLVKGITHLVGGTWCAHENDFGNHHRRHAKGYLVTFTGWLPPATDVAAAQAKIMAEFGEG